MRVLVTDAETRSALAAVRGLHAAGFTVAAAAAASTLPAPAHWSRAVAERLTVPHPLDDEAGFVAELQRTIASGQYSLLIPGSDASLLAVSNARDRLGSHTLLGLPAHGVVKRSLDKHALAAAAARHGLESPQTVRCDGADQALAAAGEFGFPVLSKPVFSIVERHGARDRFASRRTDDEPSLVRAIDDYGGRCLVQRCERGQALSFAGVFAGGRLIGEAVSRYRRTWFPDAGNVAYSTTLEHCPELSARVTGLLTELGWEGQFEVELIERRQGDWAAIDLNPRPYGSLALAIGAGVNLPALWCLHLLGHDPAPVRARPGVTYRWEDADVRHGLWQLRRGHRRAALQVLRIHRDTVHAYFSRSDPGPFAARCVDLAMSRRRPCRAGSRAGTSAAISADASPASGARRTPRAGRAGPVVVIGAGPYGLAATAFLRNAGVPARCIGDPVDFWRHQMPAGMILRSPRRATHIADPKRELTIDRYEQAERRSVRRPTLLLDEFIDYATWFRVRVAPDLDHRRVTNVARSNGSFAITLADGDELEAASVVVAAGLAGLAARPAPFDSLDPSVVSHSSDHASLEGFAGRRIVVIGAGQSALESAALLSECGATVEVLARRPAVRWLPDDTVPFARRPLMGIPPPPTGVGGRFTGWVAAAPDAFRLLPGHLKPWISARCTAPAGSGWLRPRLEDVTITCGRSAVQAREQDGKVWMLLDDGSERIADHVLLGTGYSIDVSRYSFLAPALLAQISRDGGYPRLGAGLESSVSGLHFLGAPAALSFGPIMRFVVGTWYAAPALRQRILDRPQRLVTLSF